MRSTIVLPSAQLSPSVVKGRSAVLPSAPWGITQCITVFGAVVVGEVGGVGVVGAPLAPPVCGVGTAHMSLVIGGC